MLCCGRTPCAVWRVKSVGSLADFCGNINHLDGLASQGVCVVCAAGSVLEDAGRKWRGQKKATGGSTCRELRSGVTHLSCWSVEPSRERLLVERFYDVLLVQIPVVALACVSNFTRERFGTRTISIRRLSARCSLESFGATGWNSPKPAIEIILGDIPVLIISNITVFAR